MGENPDVFALAGHDTLPSPNELRFVARDIAIGDGFKKVRILQQWQWSTHVNDFGWYDVRLAKDE